MILSGGWYTPGAPVAISPYGDTLGMTRAVQRAWAPEPPADPPAPPPATPAPTDEPGVVPVGQLRVREALMADWSTLAALAVVTNVAIPDKGQTVILADEVSQIFAALTFVVQQDRAEVTMLLCWHPSYIRQLLKDWETRLQAIGVTSWSINVVRADAVLSDALKDLGVESSLYFRKPIPAVPQEAPSQ